MMGSSFLSIGPAHDIRLHQTKRLKRCLPNRMLQGLCNTAAWLLSMPVSCYIASQRDRLQGLARPLSSAEESGLAPYFAVIDLERIRIFVADPFQIPNPPFVTMLRRLGFDFLAIQSTAAITFDHMIVSREPMSSSLLFHETTHSCQVRILGLRKFAYLYVRGFLMARSYYDIPLERCAFHLENESSPNFSVN